MQRLMGLILSVGCAVWLQSTAESQDETTGASTPRLPHASATVEDSEQKVNLNRLEEQLDEILKVQSDLLGQFDALMEDLRIAKVRVSR